MRSCDQERPPSNSVRVLGRDSSWATDDRRGGTGNDILAHNENVRGATGLGTSDVAFLRGCIAGGVFAVR